MIFIFYNIVMHYSRILSVREFKIRLIISYVFSLLCLGYSVKLELDYLKLYNENHSKILAENYHTYMRFRLGIIVVFVLICIITSVRQFIIGGKYMDYTGIAMLRATAALFLSPAVSAECYNYTHIGLNILLLNVAAWSETLFTNMYNVTTAHPDCEWLYLKNNNLLTCLICKKQINHHHYQCSSKGCNFIVHLDCSVNIKQCPICKGKFTHESLV